MTMHQRIPLVLPWWLCINATSNSFLTHYFADPAPSDFELSRYLQELLRWRAFEDDEAVIMAINERIVEQDQHLFCEGVKTLQQRWEKCVDLRRNCV